MASQAVADDIAKWMSFLDDNASVTQLTIPGTHNSHSTEDNYADPKGWPVKGFAQTQYSPVSTQLTEGVRFVDLRVGHPNFSMRHGQCVLKGILNDVLNSINEFLNQHQTETVLVSIKWDDPNNGEPGDMGAAVWSQWNTRKWYSGNEWPLLKDVRGKAILLRRFGGGPLGIDFGGFYGNQSKGSPGAWNQQDDGKSYNFAYSGSGIWSGSKSTKRLQQKSTTVACISPVSPTPGLGMTGNILTSSMPLTPPTTMQKISIHTSCNTSTMIIMLRTPDGTDMAP